MKKFISWLLVAAFIFGMGTVTAFGATGTISVPTVTGEAGDTVTVDILMDVNPGAVALKIEVGYDAALTLTDVQNGTVFPQSGMTIGGDKTANPYGVLWNNGTATENFTGTGTLVTLTFKIADNATPGDKPITLTYSAPNTFDVDFNPVTFTTAGGKVTVGGNPVDDGELSVKSVSGKPGDTVSVDVLMDKNPGAVALKIEVGYDAALTLTDVQNGDIFPQSGMTIGGDKTANPYGVLWNNGTATENFTGTGTLVTLTFKIADNATAGDKPITLSYSAANTFDVDFGSVTFTTTDGAVTVIPDIKLDKIEVKVPTKTEYFVGDTLDTAGMVVTAKYSDGSTKDVTRAAVCTPTKLDKAGTQTITVTYTEGSKTVTATFNVTVDPIPPVTGDGAISVKSVSGKPGDTVNVDILMDKNPGAVALKIEVGYDAALTLTDVQNGTVFPQSGMTIGGDKTANPYGVLWNNGTATENFTGTGTLVTLTFKIADDATAGDKPITLTYSAANTFDVDFGPVTFTMTDGAVTVTTPEKELVKIEVKEPTNTTYLVGETLDTTGMVVTATYTDGSTKDVTKEAVCTPTKLDKAGTPAITVTYTEGKTVTATFNVAVAEWNVSVDPASLTVGVGRSAKVICTCTATGDPGSVTGYYLQREIKGGYVTGEFGDWDANTMPLTITGVKEGTTTIIIRLFDADTDKLLADTTLDVTVADPIVVTLSKDGQPIDSLTLAKGAAQTILCSYKVVGNIDFVESMNMGGSCKPSGLTDGTFGDWLSANVEESSRELTITGVGVGTGEITIYMYDVDTDEILGSVTIPVTVTSPELESIAVTAPNKTEYYEGDTLNTAGMVVTATYTDGSTKDVTGAAVCTPTKLNTAGDAVPVTVQYTENGKTAETRFTVKVTAVVPESITVKAPTKTTYFVGDKLDTTGMVVTATYNNGTSKAVTGYDCAPTTLATAGEQTVTVTYSEGGKTATATFSVTVIKVALDSISVKAPTKTTYVLGETLDETGMVVTATYNNGSSKAVTGYSCSQTKLDTEGNQKIVVTYTEDGKTVTAEFSVQVVRPAVAIRNYTSNRTIDYRATITFTATVSNGVSGGAVHWFVDGADKGTGDTFTVKEATKSFTVQAKYIRNGNVLAESNSETVNVNSGFFARLVAFFRALFGRLPKITQSFFGIERIDRVLP